MILVVHGVVGGAVALSFSSLEMGLIAGFLSHFILDSIPHYDYPIPLLEHGEDPIHAELGKKEKKKTYIKVATDGLLGLILASLMAYYFDLPVWIAFLGAGFGILPDFLQFVYFKTHTKLLHHFMLFHTFMHSKVDMKQKFRIGLISYIIVFILVIVYEAYL